ncbi:MAG: PA4642 family protein [Gammaproteobacteria bacterium]|nr:PA4642 family protein [Gammaproteobacteria bacterium]
MSTPSKQRKDKAKVIDEVWTDERIHSFLETQQPSQFGKNADGDEDYYVLLRAYQAMRLNDFERFLQVFVSAGRDLNAKGPNGDALVDYVRTHRKGIPYALAIENQLQK